MLAVCTVGASCITSLATHYKYFKHERHEGSVRVIVVARSTHRIRMRERDAGGAGKWNGRTAPRASRETNERIERRKRAKQKKREQQQVKATKYNTIHSFQRRNKGKNIIRGDSNNKYNTKKAGQVVLRSRVQNTAVWLYARTKSEFSRCFVILFVSRCYFCSVIFGTCNDTTHFVWCHVHMKCVCVCVL